jgi:hypothetical protein
MLFAVLALVGCNADDERTLEDVGGLCVLGDGDSANTSYVEDMSVDVHVVLDDCASGCASDIMASCSIELDGTTLSVHASGSYQVAGGNVACPLVCLPVEATCTSAPLAAGTYTVEYAGETTTITVPSMGPAAQIGSGSCPI